MYGRGGILLARYNFPVILFPGSCVVGMYEMLFNFRTRFMYKTGHVPQALKK